MKKVFSVVIILLCAFAGYSQGIKISNLPAVTDTPALSVILPCVENTVTKKVTLQRIKDAIGVGGSDNSWSLTGNAGTNPASNFIGTTDGEQITIRSGVAGNNTSYIAMQQAGGVNNGSYNLLIRDTGNNRTLSQIMFANNIGAEYYSFLSNITSDSGSIFVQGIDSFIFQFAHNSKILKIKQTGLQYQDGTQANGYVLTSDASGNATWQAPYLLGEDSLDFGSILANGHEIKTITVTGAEESDVVTLGIPNSSMSDHASFVAWVSSADTVSVKCFNFDGSSFDPAIGLFKVKVIK